MAFCRDISERHRSDEALRDSRRQLAEAQRVARVGSWEWEPTTGRLVWSEEMYRIVGADPDKALTVQAALEFVHPDDQAIVAEAMERIVHDPTPLQFEMRTIRPDGTVRTLLARGEGICDEFGRVIRVIGTDQDVTEAKQAEEERRRLLARLYEVLEGQHQRLAADLHDEHVQNLTAITLKLDQARLRIDRLEPGAGRGLLGELREDLSEEIDALRRTIAALRPLVLDQHGLEAAVRELARSVCARAGIRTCQVTVGLDGATLSPAVETVLFRVTQQALANVEQHAAARGVRVALRTEAATAVLQVEDDGRGFDVTHIETVAGSQGFGLTSMRERVQAIGGEFTVMSRAGAGTRVEARVRAEAEP
jgi:PAS domain S-box-containing protein